MPQGSRTPGRVLAPPSPLLALSLLAALAGGCTQVRYQALAGEGALARPPGRIEVLEGAAPPHARALGQVSVVGRRPVRELERALRERAAQAGGDALVDVRHSERSDARFPGWLAWLARPIPPVRRIDALVVAFTTPPVVGDPPGGSPGGSEP